MPYQARIVFHLQRVVGGSKLLGQQISDTKGGGWNVSSAFSVSGYVRYRTIDVSDVPVNIGYIILDSQYLLL